MARPRNLTLYTFEEIIRKGDFDLIMDTFEYWLPPEDLWFVLKEDLTGKAVDMYDFTKEASIPQSINSDINLQEIYRTFKDHDFKLISNAQEYKNACKKVAEEYMAKHMFDVIDDPFTIRAMKTLMDTYAIMGLYFDSTVMGWQSFANKVHAKIQALPSYLEFESEAPTEKQPDEQGYDDYIIELNEFMFNTIPNMDSGEVETLMVSDEIMQDVYMILDEKKDINLTYFYIYLSIHMPEVIPETADNMRVTFGNDVDVALFIRKMRYVLEEK